MDLQLCMELSFLPRSYTEILTLSVLMHISPTNACHNYKINTHYNTGADEFAAWKYISPWEDFSVNPFSSDVICPKQLCIHVRVHVRISVQVLVEAHAVEQMNLTRFCSWEV